MSTPTFADVADQALQSYLARDPVAATYLGDHRHDAQLPDPSAGAAVARAAEVRGQLAVLSRVQVDDVSDSVDAAMLDTALRSELFELEELREAEWNPMVHNPGEALHGLLAREFAPLPQRLAALRGRLEQVPGHLDAARTRLAAMSRIHLDTAVAQLGGTIAVLDEELPRVLAGAAGDHSRLRGAADTARAALAGFRDWLAGQADAARFDARRGADRFARQLALTLDTELDARVLLRQAEADLDRVTAEITEQAGRIAGVARPDATTVREVLARLARSAPTDATILALCRDALAETTAFVREHDLVTVHDDPIAVLEMPETDRGVSVAYCRPAGPLEATPPPTEFAVSPTPSDWTQSQVDSFYREYNLHMLHNLTVHEAMPGHALQLAHANRFRGSTQVRAVWSSGSFIEGWAVYAEQLMAEHGYRSDVSSDAAAAVRMQQLKMQLRMIINTVMDVRYHAGDLDEAAAMALMTGAGFQEQGEASGKWRRVQLTATQLSTYYVGYLEVRGLVEQLRAARPAWTERALHDAVLGAGSPPVRHLRSLLLKG